MKTIRLNSDWRVQEEIVLLGPQGQAYLYRHYLVGWG